MSTLTLHLVHVTDDASGRLVRLESIDLDVKPAHIIARRATQAQAAGIEYVQGIDRTRTDIVAVSVSTTTKRGRMVLASWRDMPTMQYPGSDSVFTGTHDVHPLVEMTTKGPTFGKYLADRVAAAN
jgi:hypothetical protein